MTNLIDGLERHGLVERTPHPTDRRTTLAAITAKGRRTARAATEVLNAEGFGLLPLGKEELDTITRLLRRVREDADDFALPPG